MADKLGRYRKKRDFAATPEPRGGKATPPARGASWSRSTTPGGSTGTCGSSTTARSPRGRFPRGVPDHPDENRLAVHTEDHPLEYLEFEGDIPKGEYGAGTMRIWDSGTFEAEKFRDGEVIATFHGERLSGRYALFQHPRRRLDDPPDGSAGRSRLRADARAAARRCSPASASCRATRSATGSRSSGTASARSPTRTTATGASRAATSRDFTPRYPELRELSRRARRAPGGARRRGGGARRAGPAQLRADAAADAPRVGVGRQAADARPPGDLRDLRPPLPRRALHAPAALRGAPRAARAARARGPGLAHARLPPRRGQRAARRDHGRWAWRAWWPSGSTPRTSPGGARRAGSRSRTCTPRTW